MYPPLLCLSLQIESGFVSFSKTVHAHSQTFRLRQMFFQAEPQGPAATSNLISSSDLLLSVWARLPSRTSSFAAFPSPSAVTSLPGPAAQPSKDAVWFNVLVPFGKSPFSKAVLHRSPATGHQSLPLDLALHQSHPGLGGLLQASSSVLLSLWAGHSLRHSPQHKWYISSLFLAQNWIISLLVIDPHLKHVYCPL